MKLFVYGTLKRGYGNNTFLRDCKFLDEAISLHARYSMSGNGIPFLSEGGSRHVKGELWEVDESSLERIDRLEGHPDHYCRKERVFVKKSDSERVVAWVYLVDDHYGRRSGDYGELLEWPPKKRRAEPDRLIRMALSSKFMKPYLV